MASVLEGKATQAEAARLLGLSVRQVRRIQRRLEAEGDAGIVHRQRSRPSHRAKPAAMRQAILASYRRQYSDFGPTLAAEKLRRQGWQVDHETLRRWLLAEGLWRRQRKRDKHRMRRERRACFGELVQADGSHHDWLEGRGPWLVLLVLIDDATSRVVARFYPGEATAGYMDLLKRYFRKHGRMRAIYADRHSIFQATDVRGEPVATQLGRALEALDIALIAANSPQAKGRVERFNGTAQDRLVKELRLAGATTLREANRVLGRTFLPQFNRRFTVPASSPTDAHRSLSSSMDLAAILSHQERRRVANDYTIQMDNRVYQLLPPVLPGLRGGRVTVEKRLNGKMHVRLGDRYVKFRALPAAEASGALPPNPRSLSHGQTPAEREPKESSAAGTAEPPAVRLASGRSGRTPAEPCPPPGEQTVATKQPHRPGPKHPWRKLCLPGSKAKRTLLSSSTTGHS